MGTKLGDALRSLCRAYGWSYGVFWRVDSQDPRFLKMEDYYYEEHIETVMNKMFHQAHMVGEGIIGAAALSGKHHWIYSDAYCREWNPIGTIGNQDMLQGDAECHFQFLAGMKTVLIVSLPPLGVVQFGSSQKISESLEFIDQVKQLFRQLERLPRIFLYGDAQKATNISDSHAASVLSSGDSCSRFENIRSLHGDNCKEWMMKAESSVGPIQSSSIFSLGPFHGDRTHGSSMIPHVSAFPVISSSTCATRGCSDLFQEKASTKNTSFPLLNQYQTSSAGAQVSLSPNSQLSQVILQSTRSFDYNSVATFPNTNMWPNKISTQTVMEQRLLPGMGIEEFPNIPPTKSHPVIPHVNELHQFREDSTSLYSPCVTLGTMSSARPFEVSKPGLYGAGKLQELEHSSPSLSFTEGDRSAGKSFSEVPSFTPQLPPSFLTFPRELTPEEDPLDDLTQLTNQPLQQVNDGLTMPMNKDLLIVRSNASGISLATEIPCSFVENSLAGTMGSADTSCDGKESSSNAHQYLFSDNNLFDGLELDLSLDILGQECWDDVIMPVGSGNCSNLSPSISECISEFGVGSTVGVEKGLGTESGLEQLLDAVVGGNVNFSSSYSSAATKVNSASNPDVDHQFSATTRVGCTQVYKNEVPLVGLPCFSRPLDVLLPECNLENIVHGSSKEALAGSQVSSWIDDSYSMNAESAAINQPKRPEEAVKVARKRARPGESTRPRPKDRQQIQDRVKELREIVPNGSKCSIDALLDRTIKHMLFLQSVTKHADQIKQADEPKMIGEGNCVVLKDKSSNAGGGATWAYEMAGQTMVCPLIVEDLNPPGQMLVEMLCEERGVFLEIADMIRGFGLTILKGVMEIRDRKIWARFLVEVNRNITRMDIFLSLVQLLQRTSRIHSGNPVTKVIDDGVPTFTTYQQSPMPIPISLADSSQCSGA